MNKVSDLLFSKKFINIEQQQALNEYQKLGSFFIRNELLFTTELGISIYQYADTIGHTILLILLAIATATCFCFSYKKSGDFSENEVHFKNSWYNYLVLFTTVLRDIFISYFQYAISFENSNDSLTTLISEIKAH
jgi:hypothetical protein